MTLRNPQGDRSTNRRYDVSGRAEDAQRRRRAVLLAAETLFAHEGFAATTIAAIARDAGVSAPLVYAAFGSKAGLLGALLTQVEERADRDNWVARLAQESDAAQRWWIFVIWSRRLYEEAAGMIRAAYRGAGEDPAVASLRTEGDRRRRAGIQGLVERDAKDGRLSKRLTTAEATARAQILTSPAVFLICTADEGWSGEVYEQWLAETLIRDLLEE